MTAPTSVDAAVTLARVRRWGKDGTARRIRQAAGLSLMEVARAVGVRETSVMRWERGERAPHGDPALRYADLLNRIGEASDDR